MTPWDRPHRTLLFRWPNQGPHSPRSIRPSNGRILTVFMHVTSYSWTDQSDHPYPDRLNLVFVGNVSIARGSIFQFFVYHTRAATWGRAGL